MNVPEYMGWVADLLQFIVAGYALRLNRLFGTARVGWSLFSAFSLLALLHLSQTITPFHAAITLGTEFEVVYTLISLLLLTGMVHLETLLRERLRAQAEERRIKGELESEVKRKTAHLTRAIEELQSEIDERKRMEAQVEAKEYELQAVSSKTEHLFRSFMEGLPDMVYFKDTNSRFIRANRALANRLGEPNVAAVLGKSDFDYFSAEHARAAYEAEQEIVRTGQPLMDIEEKETWWGQPDSWVSTTKLPLRDEQGRIVGIFGLSRDITERKRAEERIGEQARLLDLVHEAVIVRDMEDRVLYWNNSAERIYGWSAQEAAGQNAAELLHQDASIHAEAKRIALEKGEWRGEFRIRARTGQDLIVETGWTLVHDIQGNPKSILCISTDITKKKKLEAQAQRAQRMESLGTLAGGIAHDLNNVLAPLLMSVQLLKNKVDDKDGQKLLSSLEANVLRGAKLIKQVLAFGRGVNGDRTSVQLGLVIRELEQIIHETFPKSVEFEKQLPGDLWNVTGDSTQLYQVLLNLCVNARDAMPLGGRLCIQLENVLLDQLYAGMYLEAKPGLYVVIKVSDTGTGIPNEIRERIFEPFFTTKGHGMGTGLGLSTCLGIVKSHGGFIDCYSEPGKGTAFKVYLPADTQPASPGHTEFRPAGLPRGHNELVLVVDDEKAIRDVGQKTLEHFGYRVLTATNGAEAVSIYRQQQSEIDAVIIDMAMPVMDGNAAIAALKMIQPKVKIISASGLETESTTNAAEEADRRVFISKPYTAEILLQTLHKVLSPN
jgi:PAS domain S-box-containing protein